jgi:hypothetical protein
VVTPAWVSNLAIGQWAQIPNTAISGVEPSPVPPGNGPRFKVDGWNSFVVDTRTSTVYSVANGGHADYAGNEVDALNLEVAQPQWVQKVAPTPSGQLGPGGQDFYPDGRPASRHSYYGVVLNASDDRIMLFGGAIWGTQGGFGNATSSYNITGNFYSTSSTHPDIPGAPTAGAYSLNPLTGDIYMNINWTLYRWNRSANTWSTLNPTGSPSNGYYTMSAMDPSRGRIFFLGGPDANHHLYTIANNAWAAVTLGGSNAGDVAAAEEAAMFYVPAFDRFLVRKAAAGGTVYIIDPQTFAVTTLATTGGGSIPGTINGPFNKFLYVPRLGGAVYVPTYSGNAWFLRLH